MIDDWSPTGLGWARFSDDRKLRYRLARFTSPRICQRWKDSPRESSDVKIATFVMLNPSTADAFKLDPTVGRCLEFSRRWGCDVLEVVNLFALRSPYPADLYSAARSATTTGANPENDLAIVDACHRAQFVIAAWGNHGRLMERAAYVTELLDRAGVELRALRILDGGIPSHPLARGKNFIPYTTTPVRFTP